jgi:hypothetical protein
LVSYGSEDRKKKKQWMDYTNIMLWTG